MRSSILYFIAVFSVLVMSVSAAEIAPDPDMIPHLDTYPRPDKLISKKKIIGRLFDGVAGDYYYAVIKTEQGILESFMVSSEICFLVQNRKQILNIDYDEIERFIPEGAGYYPENIIHKISTNDGKNHWDINEYVNQTNEQRNKCDKEFLNFFKDRRGT